MADPLLGLGLPLLLLLAGTVMMLAEAVIPGAQFVVVGVALFFSGLVGLLFEPFSSIVALTLMTVAFGVFAFFAFREMDLYNGPDHGKTSDSDDLSGETAVVTETITSTGGAVRLASGGGFDPNYRARSEHGDIEEGEEVIVTDPGGGNVLTVMSMDAVRQDSIDRELARGRDDETASRATEDEGGAAATDASTAESSASRDDSASSGAESSSRDDGESESETETERA